MFERLLDGTLLVAFDGDEIMALARADAPPALMAFTGPDSLALWGPVTRAKPVASSELMAFAAAGGFRRLIVDPAGPVTAELSRLEIEALAEGRIPAPGDSLAEDRGEVVELGPLLARVADDFVAGLRQALEAAPGVAAAYLFEAAPLDGARRLVIGLELDDPAAEVRLVDGMRAELADVAPARTQVDWTVVLRDEKLAALRERVEPLYER